MFREPAERRAHRNRPTVPKRTMTTKMKKWTMRSIHEPPRRRRQASRERPPNERRCLAVFSARKGAFKMVRNDPMFNSCDKSFSVTASVNRSSCTIARIRASAAIAARSAAFRSKRLSRIRRRNTLPSFRTYVSSAATHSRATSSSSFIWNRMHATKGNVSVPEIPNPMHKSMNLQPMHLPHT